MLEDGRLTDSAGRTVSFRQSLIILTSNVGSQLIAKGGQGLGFELEAGDAEAAAGDRMRSLVLGELKAHFRPEFLNRLDEIVVRPPPPLGSSRLWLRCLCCCHAMHRHRCYIVLYQLPERRQRER